MGIGPGAAVRFPGLRATVLDQHPLQRERPRFQYHRLPEDDQFPGAYGDAALPFQRPVSLGVTAGWNVFYEKRARPLCLRGRQHDALRHAVPLHQRLPAAPESAGALWRRRSQFKPYAGLGLGTTYFIQNTNMGLYAFREKEWLLGLYPRWALPSPSATTGTLP
jgi:hypothetical protein